MESSPYKSYLNVDAASPKGASAYTDLNQIGLEVFGDLARFQQWLESPNSAFGGARPNNLIQTPEGQQRVIKELVRIEIGMFG